MPHKILRNYMKELQLHATQLGTHLGMSPRDALSAFSQVRNRRKIDERAYTALGRIIEMHNTHLSGLGQLCRDAVTRAKIEALKDKNLELWKKIDREVRLGRWRSGKNVNAEALTTHHTATVALSDSVLKLIKDTPKLQRSSQYLKQSRALLNDAVTVAKSVDSRLTAHVPYFEFKPELRNPVMSVLREEKERPDIGVKRILRLLTGTLRDHLVEIENEASKKETLQEIKALKDEHDALSKEREASFALADKSVDFEPVASHYGNAVKFIGKVRTFLDAHKDLEMKYYEHKAQLAWGKRR